MSKLNVLWFYRAVDNDTFFNAKSFGDEYVNLRQPIFFKILVSVPIFRKINYNCFFCFNANLIDRLKITTLDVAELMGGECL